VVSIKLKQKKHASQQNKKRHLVREVVASFSLKKNYTKKIK